MQKTGPFQIFLPVWIALSLLLFPDPGREQRVKKPEYGGVLRVKSLADTFRMQLDPVQSESYIFLSEHLYDGLVRLDKNQRIVPSLAEYWMISADGEQYTFFLKKRIFFHDGTELTADDVKFSLERILDRNVGSPFYRFFYTRVEGAADFRDGQAEEVSGIRAVGRYTLEIHWTRPYVPALYLLGMHFCKILPREKVLRQGENFFQKPVGTGPFRFEYWIRDNRLNEVGVRLERNDSYFREKPFLEAVEFCPLYTVDHFVDGEIDCTPVLTDRLTQSRYRILHDSSLQTVFLGMSCHISPLDSPVVRNAIRTGLDRQAVIDAIHEVRYARRPTSRYIPAGIPGFFALDVSSPCDRDAARKQLEEAGYFTEKEFPRLILYIGSPRTEFKRKFAREIRNQLEILGIETNVTYFRSPEQVKETLSPYLILTERMMGMPDPDDLIRPLFCGASDANLYGYSNASVEALLQAAEAEKSWSRRIKVFHQIEKILLQDVPAIPLYAQQNRVALQPHVRGVAVPRLGMYYLDARKIWIEK